MPDENPPESLYGLKTLQGEAMTAPETRVADAESLRSIARRIVLDDEPRSFERALVRGLLQGNAPYDALKRKSAGQSWQANLNFMEGEAAIDAARVPYYQLFSGVKEYAVCKCKPGYFGDDPQATERAGQRVSMHFHALLKGWTHFDWHMQNCFAEMLRWGYAPLIGDAGGSWKFKSVDSKCVPPQNRVASAVDDRLPRLLIVESFTVSELWKKIRDEDAAEKAGWNVKAVKRAIQQAARGLNTTEPWSSISWEEWQRRYKNNDDYVSANSEMIFCYRMLVNEFRKESKISQFIVTQGQVFDDNAKEDKSADAGFLFRHIDRYDAYEEAIVVFFQNTGDGTWASVRGMGQKGFKHWDSGNKMMCKAIDNAFQRSAIVLSTDTVKSADQLQLMVFSDRTILPPGTKVEQMGFAGDIEGVLAVKRVLDNNLANNLGVYNQRSISRDDGRGEMPTATQVQNQVAKEASLTAGQISVTYTALSLLYFTTFKKAVKSSEEDAVAFREACQADGIPIEVLKDMECVYANQQSGYGSNAMRQQVLQQLAPIVPGLPEEGKLAYSDMVIAASAGVDKIDVLNPRAQIPQQDDSLAAAENGAMAAGCAAIVSSGQDNVNHLLIHIPEIERRVSPLREAMEQEEPTDPAELQSVYEFLQLAGPHCEEHLAKIEQDPTRAQLGKQFRAQLQLYVAFNGKLRSAMQTARREAQIAAQEQQNATALGALDQAKLNSAQLADQIKAEKWTVDKSIKLNKADTAARLSAFKTQHSSLLADATTAATIQRERAKAKAA